MRSSKAAKLKIGSLSQWQNNEQASSKCIPVTNPATLEHPPEFTTYMNSKPKSTTKYKGNTMINESDIPKHLTLDSQQNLESILTELITHEETSDELLDQTKTSMPTNELVFYEEYAEIFAMRLAVLFVILTEKDIIEDIGAPRFFLDEENYAILYVDVETTKGNTVVIPLVKIPASYWKFKASS